LSAVLVEMLVQQEMRVLVAALVLEVVEEMVARGRRAPPSEELQEPRGRQTARAAAQRVTAARVVPPAVPATAEMVVTVALVLQETPEMQEILEVRVAQDQLVHLQTHQFQTAHIL
jgi:hypothetical protein